MSWHPLDLVADQDLVAYERELRATFNAFEWEDKRTKALEDWLFPTLKANGFDPYALVTRAAVSKAFAYTGSAYSDVTTAASDSTADDLNLGTIFATAGSDALYIGSDRPFRGLFVRMLDTVSATTSTVSVAYFNGAWQPLLVTDGTARVAGKTFSGGGSIVWTLPVDWQRRRVNSSDALYWVKVTVSATPSAARVGQIGVIRASVLRAPATYRTLQLIFQEAPIAQDGPWAAKAEYYKDEADAALQRALQICGGEFDTDGSDLIDGDEATQTAAQAGGGGVVLERG